MSLFSNKRKQPAQNVLLGNVEGPDLVGHVTGDITSDAFQLKPGGAYHNPAIAWHAFLDANHPVLTLLLWPGGEPITFDLRSGNRDTWLSLTREGQTLPFQVYLSSSGIFGKWVVVLPAGHSVTDARPPEYTEEDRRKDTALAFDLLRMKHDTAMTQIMNIRY